MGMSTVLTNLVQQYIYIKCLIRLTSFLALHMTAKLDLLHNRE